MLLTLLFPRPHARGAAQTGVGRPEAMFATMWEELLSDLLSVPLDAEQRPHRLHVSPHLPLHHLTAAFAMLLFAYQVSDSFAAGAPLWESSIVHCANSGAHCRVCMFVGCNSWWAIM